MELLQHKIKNASVSPPEHIWEALEQRLETGEIELSMPAIEAIQMLKRAEANPPSSVEFKIFRRLERVIVSNNHELTQQNQFSNLVISSYKIRSGWAVAAGLILMAALWFLVSNGPGKPALRNSLTAQINKTNNKSSLVIASLPFAKSNYGVVPNRHQYGQNFQKNHLHPMPVTITPGMTIGTTMDAAAESAYPELHAEPVSVDAAVLPGIFGAPVSLDSLPFEVPIDQGDFWVAGFTGGQRIAIPKRLIGNGNVLAGTDSTNNIDVNSAQVGLDTFKEWWSLLEASGNTSTPIKVYTVEYPSSDGRLESIVVVQ